MAHGSIISALILMSCAVVASYMVPNPAQKCKCDRDCPGAEKCCRYYHHSVCAPPVSRLPRCPIIRKEIAEIAPCIVECSGNRDCKHNDICCFNGCGRVCVSRKQEKPGSCGERRFTRECQGHACEDDFECYGDLKCCPSRCGSACAKPIYWQRNELKS